MSMNDLLDPYPIIFTDTDVERLRVATNRLYMDILKMREAAARSNDLGSELISLRDMRDTIDQLWRWTHRSLYIKGHVPRLTNTLARHESTKARGIRT